MKRINLHTILIGLTVLMLGALVIEEYRWSVYAYERWGFIPFPDDIKLAAYFLAVLPAVVAVYLKQQAIPVLSMWKNLFLGVVQIYLITAFIGGIFFLLFFSAFGFHEYRVEGDSFSAALGLVGAVTSGLFCYLLWCVRRSSLVDSQLSSKVPT